MRTFKVMVQNEEGTTLDTVEVKLRDDDARYDQIILQLAKSTSWCLGRQCGALNIPCPLTPEEIQNAPRS